MHRVVELMGTRQVKDLSNWLTGAHCRVISILGNRSNLVSQVSCLGNALGVVGLEKFGARGFEKVLGAWIQVLRIQRLKIVFSKKRKIL